MFPFRPVSVAFVNFMLSSLKLWEKMTNSATIELQRLGGNDHERTGGGIITVI